MEILAEERATGGLVVVLRYRKMQAKKERGGGLDAQNDHTGKSSSCLINRPRAKQIEACLFKHHFYKRGHSKEAKQRALHVHQTKTKHFIAKLFTQPIDS